MTRLAARLRAASPWTLATLALLAALLAFALFTFDAHNISNDEPVQHHYGEMLIEFYRSGFRDRSLFGYLNLYHYGGLFDMVAVALARVLPVDPWDLRHLLTGLTGVAGLAATARLASVLVSPRAGFLAVLILAVTGNWTGAMFTHTKDVPFAVATIFAVLGMTRLMCQLPAPRTATVIGTGIAMGCALGLRFGGVLLPAYLALCVAVAYLRGAPLPSLLRLWPLPVVTLALMGFFWPWSVTGWDHFLITATSFSHYPLDLRTLIDGAYVPAREVPSTYVFQYLVRSLPELFLWGLLVAIVVAARELTRSRTMADLRAPPAPGADPWLAALPLLLAIVVPMLIVLLRQPALYNGLRHFTFLLPPLAVLAGLGLDRALVAMRGLPRLRAAHVALLTVLALDSVVTQVRLHPYGYVSYNRLSGGLAHVWGRWETDYWNEGMREAALRLNALVDGDNGGRPWRVAVCAESVQALHHLDERFVATSDWPEADFFITSTSTRCDRALAGDVVIEVVRDGVTLDLVKDRRRLPPDQRAIRVDATTD